MVFITAVLKNIFLLQLFDDICWHVLSVLWYLYLHTFLYLMWVYELCIIFLHWIAYIVKFCRYCSFLIGYQKIYLFFAFICGVAATRSDFFNGGKILTFSMVYRGESVPLNMFGEGNQNDGFRIFISTPWVVSKQCWRKNRKCYFADYFLWT